MRNELSREDEEQAERRSEGDPDRIEYERGWDYAADELAGHTTDRGHPDRPTLGDLSHGPDGDSYLEDNYSGMFCHGYRECYRAEQHAAEGRRADKLREERCVGLEAIRDQLKNGPTS